MPTFKPNEEAQVTDNFWTLGSYGMGHAAGRRVRIICKGIKDNYEGYEVEHTDVEGTTYTYFIYSDHLVPVSSNGIIIKKPRWKQVADRWEKKLWTEKMEK